MMLNWFLNKLTDHWEKKCQKKIGGIPMLWVIYEPDKPVPNMIFYPHPMFSGDTILNAKCKDIADYMRSNYLEKGEYEWSDI